jgi:hypothetical protein
MTAARLTFDDACDVEPGGGVLDEESKGGESDSRHDIQCVFEPFSAYIRHADAPTGAS